MRAQLWSKLAGVDQCESEHGALPGLKMDRHFEAFGEQRLHHQAELVLDGIVDRCLRFNRPTFRRGAGPIRYLSGPSLSVPVEVQTCTRTDEDTGTERDT